MMSIFLNLVTDVLAASSSQIFKHDKNGEAVCLQTDKVYSREHGEVSRRPLSGATYHSGR